MKAIILFLILFTISSLGDCSNHVPVLKYKSGNECASDVIGVQIKSTLSTLEEFTFCGKYYFRFLRESILVGIEPDLVLAIEDFEEKVGFLYYQGVWYNFYFPNQTVTPDSGQYICLAISSNQLKVVWNGKILPSDLKVDLPQTEIKDTKLWLGGALFSDIQNNRFEGVIANVDFWKDALQDDDLISITKNENAVIISNKYDLQFNAKPNSPSCIEILEENQVLFQNLKKDLLIPIKIDFDSSKCFCEGHGGILTIPKSERDLKTIGGLIKKSVVCDFAFLGLKKSTKKEILDLEDNIVSYLEWGLNQPNGDKTHQCIATDSNSAIYDVKCSMKYCWVCQLPEKRMFILRGSIPTDTERKYFVTTKTNEIRGLTKTECSLNEGKWNFGTNLKQDNATGILPVGLKTWNNGQKFKFTQCKNDEFTCHKYGHCIALNKRCNGYPDCPFDGSDEKECKIMTLETGYDRMYSSEKNLTSHLELIVYDITDVDEIHMSKTVNFKTKLHWHDSRITFRNLKSNHKENTLDDLEIEKIWTPKLYIEDSNGLFLEAGWEKKDNYGSVTVFKDGSQHTNELSEIDEDYLYHGTENKIQMKNYFVIKLGCKFDLKWYPFDTQKCPIQLRIRGNFENQFVLNWMEPPEIKEMHLTQYNVPQYLDYENYSSPQTLIGVEITLCRKLAYHVFNIYIPTLILAMIAGFTLFIDFSHFEVSIMIALTSMLVTYTLYQSISANLPHTSYMKMIDVWLFGGLIFPFFIIAILVIMDFLIMREKNLVIDFKDEGNGRLKSAVFMKSMQIMLLTVCGTLCIAYWIVGLYHYHNACPI